MKKITNQNALSGGKSDLIENELKHKTTHAGGSKKNCET